MAIRRLYHGSDKIIKTPRYAYGDTMRDFGVGFYCTENKEMGMEWASTYRNQGFLNVYEMNTEYLYILDLSSEEHSVMEWIALILYNRRFRITDAAAETNKNRIIEAYLPKLDDYDAIIGMRADDSNYALVRAFLNGDLSEDALKRIFDTRRDQNQICFISPKCFRLINHIESYVASKRGYYDRQIRDERLRELIERAGLNIPSPEENMGELIEYAAEACHLDMNDFFAMLEATHFFDTWEIGDSKLYYGMSGCEIAMDILKKSGKQTDAFPLPLVRMVSGVNDWMGRLLCHAKSEMNMSISALLKLLSYDELSEYYPKCYMDSIEAAAELIAGELKERHRATKLSLLRKERGLSQRKLSELSGVNLRTLQQYEINAKNIKKASADKAIKLSRALGVEPEELL